MDTVLENRTPHEILLIEDLVNDGQRLRLAPVLPTPRLTPRRVELGRLAGFPIVRTTMGEVQDLPAPREGVILVVSALVAEASPERADLAYPGEAIRDAAGKVIAARGLCAGPGLHARLLAR